LYNGVYDVEQFAYLQEPLMKWLSLKIAGKSLADILKERGVHEVAIYGIHELGKLVYQDLNHSEISINCFIDKRAGEYPNGYQGVPVIPLEELGQSEFDGFILVTPEFYFHDILQNLLKEGVSLEKMISLAMIV
jgi:hypothetical protein